MTTIPTWITPAHVAEAQQELLRAMAAQAAQSNPAEAPTEEIPAVRSSHRRARSARKITLPRLPRITMPGLPQLPGKGSRFHWRKIVRRLLIAALVCNALTFCLGIMLYITGLLTFYAGNDGAAGFSVGTERYHIGMQVTEPRGIFVCWAGKDVVNSCD